MNSIPTPSGDPQQGEWPGNLLPFTQPPARPVLVRTYSVGQGLSTKQARIPPSGSKEPVLSNARPCHLSTVAVPKRPAQPSTITCATSAGTKHNYASFKWGPISNCHHSGALIGPKQEKKGNADWNLQVAFQAMRQRSSLALLGTNLRTPMEPCLIRGGRNKRKT